jgi:hypothetical protein
MAVAGEARSSRSGSFAAGARVKLPQFERSWHGIKFADLPVKVPASEPADDRFYQAFYAALRGRPVDSNWLKEKQEFGRWLETELLRKFATPRILSVAAGLAVAEQEWLAQGYDVALNECQSESLTTVRSKFPSAPLLIGNAHEIEIRDHFDIITVLTVDYALDNDDLLKMFKRLGECLNSRGVIVNQTVNVLTVRRFFTEFVKRWLLRRYNEPGWIRWGWNRSPDSIIALARKAGLEVKTQYIRKENGFRLRPRLLWHVPPLRKPEIAMIFCKREP